MAAATVATGQSDIIGTCRVLPTDKERIACLEAAVTDRDAGTSSAPEESQSAGGNSRPDSDEDRSADAPTRDDTASPASTDPSPASRPSKEAGEDANESIGERQVRTREGTEDDLESASGLRVAEYGQAPYRRLQVTLANGQVWRQIEGDTQRIRVDLRRNQTVDINESGLGGYQLRLNEVGRTIRVERVR